MVGKEESHNILAGRLGVYKAPIGVGGGGGHIPFLVGVGGVGQVAGAGRA